MTKRNLIPLFPDQSRSRWTGLTMMIFVGVILLMNGLKWSLPGIIANGIFLSLGGMLGIILGDSVRSRVLSAVLVVCSGLVLGWLLL